MSIAIQRDQIIHLDGYNWNKRREPDKPLLSQLAEDMLANGFEDVGPEIVKISCNDEQLSRYIDNLLVYYYDSSSTARGEGAYGIKGMNEPDVATTSYLLDGNNNFYKEIQDDPYKDASGSNWDGQSHWADDLAVNLDSKDSRPDTIPLTDYADFLGPNVELFSFLNPHPDERDLDGNWLKKRPNSPERAQDNAAQKGMYGLNFISERVYQNEFAKIKRLITTSARGVLFYPDSGTGLDSKGNLRYYAETQDTDGKVTHNFWVSTYKDESFFPVNEIEPKPWKGQLAFGVTAGGTLQLGDSYNITLTAVNLKDDQAQNPVIVNVPVTTTSITDFLEDVQAAIVGSNIGAASTGLLISNINPDATGILDIEGVLNGYDLGHTNNNPNIWNVAHSPYVFQGFTNTTTNSETDDILTTTSKQLVDNHTMYINLTVSDGFGLDTSKYTDINNVDAINGGSYDSGTYGAYLSWTHNSYGSSQFYRNGYVHAVEVSGWQGADPGDKFEITLDNLVDESAEDPKTADTISISVPITINKAYTSPAALLPVIVQELKKDPYIKQYMDISYQAGTLFINYNTNSSAYMVRSRKTGDDLGLMELPSERWRAAKTFDVSTLSEFSQSVLDTEYANNGYTIAQRWDQMIPATMKYGLTNVYTDVSGVALEEVAIKHVGYPGGSTQQTNDYIFIEDVPDLAKFETTIAYTPVVPQTQDPLTFEVLTTQEAAVSNTSSVRLSFPLARDMGTFANPPSSTNWDIWFGIEGSSKKSNYPMSYTQQILSDTNRTTKASRPDGPQVSFDYSLKDKHPNVSHGTSDLGLTNYKEFAYHIGNLDIESFEYVKDYSIGPLVFETSRSSTLSGLKGDQPWRVRFNISRGYQVQDASPYISDAHVEVTQDEAPSDIDARSFEYLQVHAGTQYQIKSNGDVTSPQGVDVTKPAIIREPGFMGAIRPQYTGYVRTNVHVINPFVNRPILNEALASQINTYAGRVGYYHDALEGINDSKLLGVWTNTANGTDDVTYTNGRGTITKGLLANNEYRYEERYLSGTSSELLYDTPFQTASLRLQKGLFRRTGKQFSDVAPTYPMSYTLTVTDHGIAFYIKDHASADQADDNAWFVIQRHVDSTTGEADFSSEQQPVHCVYMTSEPPLLYSDLQPFFDERVSTRDDSVAKNGLYDIEGNFITDFMIDPIIDAELRAFDIEGQGRFRRFVVREKDTLKPWDRHVFAGLNEIDSHAVLNPLEQLSLNDDGQLVIQFPNRVGTQRYLYTGKELDMIAFCDGGSVGQDTLVTSDRFSTTGTTNKRRIYKGMMSTKAYGNGMRVLFLSAGWGVDSTYILPENLDL